MVRANAFRGLRFDPAVVGDPGAVTAPALDAVELDRLASYAAASPHNVVRLILAGQPPSPHGAPPAATSPQPVSPQSAGRPDHLLHDWLARGALVLDPTPGVYAYEHTYTVHGVTRRQRGVVASVPLDPARATILPHEKTMPLTVESRRHLLEATGVNLSPIFAVYSGGGRGAAAAAAMTTGTPLLTTRDPSGVTHRLWQVTDPDQVAAWQAAVADRELLIADGHHRYDAALAYRAQRRARHPHQAAGPWDETLMFLVDADADGPNVSAVHRLLGGVDPHRLAADARAWARTRPLHTPGGGRPDVAAVTSALAAEGDRPAFALYGRDAAWLLQPHRDPAADGTAAPLDVEVLHDRLRGHPGGPALTIGYEPDPVRAARLVDQGRFDAAVLLRPAGIPDVLAVARAGRTLPEKTTRFWPKPRDGMVLRPLYPPKEQQQPPPARAAAYLNRRR